MHKAIGRILAALGVLALAVGIAQSSLVQPKSTGLLPHRSSNSETPAAPQQVLPRNPWMESDCESVDTIPEKRGDFCTKLKKGVPVKVIPPMGTSMEIKVSGKTTVDYIGWNQEHLQKSVIEGDNQFICAPKGTRSLTLTSLKEEGQVRVLIGKPKSPEFTKCS